MPSKSFNCPRPVRLAAKRSTKSVCGLIILLLHIIVRHRLCIALIQDFSNAWRELARCLSVSREYLPRATAFVPHLLSRSPQAYCTKADVSQLLRKNHKIWCFRVIVGNYLSSSSSAMYRYFLIRKVLLMQTQPEEVSYQIRLGSVQRRPPMEGGTSADHLRVSR